MDIAARKLSHPQIRSHFSCATSRIGSIYPGCLQDDVYIYLFGSAPKTESSWNGVMSIGAPLFQRPSIRALRRSLPSARVKTIPSTGMRYLFKKKKLPGWSASIFRFRTRVSSRSGKIMQSKIFIQKFLSF